VASFLRFLLLFGVLLAALVLVVLPLALGPLLAQQLRDHGLEAESLNVGVGLFDPGLVLGHARSITVDATGVSAGSVKIGRARITLGDVGLFDRTFDNLSGELDDISVSASGETLGIASVQLDGAADEADATGRLSQQQADDLVMNAARRQGLALDAVHFSDAGVSVSAHGFEAPAHVAVRGGALVFDPGVSGAIVLVQPEPSDAWRLDEAWITAEGLNVHGTVDVARLVSQLNK
jgi:hypothetical protein